MGSARRRRISDDCSTISKTKLDRLGTLVEALRSRQKNGKALSSLPSQESCSAAKPNSAKLQFEIPRLSGVVGLLTNGQPALRHRGQAKLKCPRSALVQDPSASAWQSAVAAFG